MPRIDRRSAVAVPGGVIRVDPQRGQSRLHYWLRVAYAGATLIPTSVKGDIVIEDSSGRVVYRAGPYGPISVVPRWNALVSDISQVGVDDFLARQRILYGREAPYVISEPNPVLEASWRYYVGWVGRLFRRRPNDP